MLQRSAVLQKRSLEWTLARCKRVSADTYQHQRSLASVRYAIRTTSSSEAAIECHPSSTNPISQRISDKLATWTATSSPFPEFAPIMHALALNDPFERVIENVKSSPELLDLFSDKAQLREVVIGLGQSPDPRRAIEILNLAHRLQHTLKHGAYEAVAFTLANAHQWELVLWVATSGIKHVGRATVRLLNWRARALLELQQYGLLQNIIQEFQTASLTPTVRTFQIVLSGCLRNHDMQGATFCLKQMDEANVPTDDRIQVMLDKFYQHFGLDSGFLQDALDRVSTLDAKSSVALVNNVVSSILNTEDVVSAIHLLKLFDPNSVSVINATFSDTDRRKPFHKIQLPDLPSTLKPNTQTFVLFMNHLIRTGNYQRAMNVGEHALSNGFSATPSLVTSLIHAFFLQNRGNVGVEIVSRLSNQSTAEEFAALKSTHVQDAGPQIPNITGILLSTRICNALLRGVLQRQGLRNVPKILAIMHANDIRPNTRTLEIILSYLSRTEAVRPRTILSIMQDLSASSFDVSIRHMHHLIQYILREEKRDLHGGGWATYDKKNLQIQKNHATGRNLSGNSTLDPLGGLDFGTHTGYSLTGIPLIESLLSRDVKSDPVMISMRIRRDALVHGEFNSAQDAFESLSARGMSPNHHHFSALMEGYALMGELESAKNVMRAAQQRGVQPNAVMFTILIHGYGRQHDTKMAMQTFQEMVSIGIYPDVAAIDAVVGAYFAAGARKAARDHLILLWTYVEPFPDSLRDASLGTLIAHFRSLEPSHSRLKHTKLSKASVYHQVKRILVAYQRYFEPVTNKNKNS